MKFTLKAAIAALSLSAVTLSATPAAADPPPWAGHGKHGNPGHGRDDWRHGGKHDRWARPGRVIYSYDWNRPDPRYGRYYRPDRYYRGGYESIRVTRNTRIYRGYDDRYYCRRSDGTTGLIGSQLDRGRSNTAGILIGGGAGALLGREIDRGSLNCR